MNQVQLIGRLTRDLQTRENSNGTTYCFFTVAIDEYRKDGKNQTNYIECIAYNATARNMSQYVGKGSLVGVTGSISTRTNKDDNGNYQTTTTIVANRVEFLESKGASRAQNQQSSNDNYVRNDSNVDMDFVNGFEQEENHPSQPNNNDKDELFKDDDSILWD
ncbi:single-stranded DNA-binding protein [Mesoplasma lactucae]|uniref:Single-stranded DNA-binding protein n=1 Tax=Mesoplasma lactucae ATCC 49193 TaxID=81460 RepID=A0A291ISH2_9MOLU|nr:single-stranded DNA-binding protein [Mesoplasma lactucae]ATG97678.1 single-stranded DNA-binding protein [Mesoplasma lactucae ATCC 49193]ATZ19857.1 single-strand DNA-binding protein [Mesoplasma lactucae ATCC 49193]MCL8216720.1 Single-stranded DNA-binding protein [Mesoplasma lactucae ATCC 49193]